MTSWSALRCLPRNEILVSKELEALGFESLCPTYRVKRLRLGQQIEDSIPVVSTYVFFRGNFDSNYWYQIRKIKGVLQILNGLINHYEIESFRSWIGEDGDYWKTINAPVFDLSPGQLILLREGIFEGKFGKILTVSENFCEILLNSTLLGYEVVVNQPKFWCEPSSETAASTRPEIRRKIRGGRRHHRWRQTSSNSHAEI